MPVSFPPNPTIGQLYTFAGVTWEWNGTTWVNANQGTSFMPIGGGSFTGPVTLAPGSSATRVFNIQGVTDGSNAAAGMVGEYLTANGSITSPPQQTLTTVFSLSLTAGDWDVSGFGSVSSSASAISSVLFTLASTQVAGLTIPATPFFAGGTFAFPSLRFSSASTQTVTLSVTAAYSGVLTCDGTLYARRVR